MSRLFRSGMVISIMTLMSRVLGLVRDAVYANYFVMGSAMDAFLVAFRIPNLMRRLSAEGAFSLAFIPVLTEYKEKKSKEELKDLIDHVAGLMGLILFIVSLIAVIASPLLMMVFAPGFEAKPDAEPELAAYLLKITAPYMLFISLAAFFSSILNAFGNFAVPAFTPVLLNVVMISAAIWWAPAFEEPVEALAWGVFIGGIVQAGFQLPFLQRLGLVPHFSLKKGHEGVKRIMKLMGPALLGSSAAQLNITINTMIASTLTAGSISWLYFSDRFVEFPLALIGVAIGTVILPKLSGDHANAEGKAFSGTLDWAMRLSLLVSIPATVGLIVLAVPILATVIDNGVNGWRDVEMASLSLMTYALGLPAFIMVKVLAPGFYSRQDTRTPVRIGLIAIVANIVCNIAIVLPWYKLGFIGPHAGLALSTAISGFVNATLLFIGLRKQGMIAATAGWPLYLMKIVIASLCMAAVVWYVNPADSWWQDSGVFGKIAALGGLVLSAMLTYLLAILAMGIRPRQLLRV
ncbi:murein biosynthesis integral membrane protein MurJ [Leucothrix pacifica]|uniref:Probable lipid II flippase MurJ n=1 Tax=Leucothrix pacifica TaxID=1247513 RepID=A0A317CJE3_9GAMM|nr:murein biosynthesis integral membrane protein MurJ [Leucothrix pacifica]PWQ96452.1 murein biosynthesis integral membrane protein MurJ [Leucothrix pacifica]